MARIVVVEDVSLTANYILDTLALTQCEVVVLYDITREPIKKRPEIIYQPIAYLELSQWQSYIEKEDIVLLNTLPEMFGDGLWHGDVSILRQLVRGFVLAAAPMEVIEYDDVIAKQKMKTKQAASLQCMSIPYGYTISQSLTAYAQYLKKISLGLIQVKGQPEQFDIHFLKMKRPLIAMKQWQQTDSVKLTIQSNSLLFQPKNKKSSFYFIHSGHLLYTYLIHFTPRLPWFIYRISQAVVHEWVMRGFRSYLKYLNQGNDK